MQKADQKKRYFILIVLLVVMTSCTDDRKFNKGRWLRNSNVNDTWNPRAYMTDDLLKNVLKPGLTKEDILNLLGKPYKDEVDYRLPKGLQIPDSIGHHNTLKLNEFYHTYSQPDTLMLYPVGWSTIDPNFLVIKFDSKGIAYDFWVEQH